MQKGYLYIIQNRAWPKWVKVGITTNIKNRLHTYQTGAPLRDYKVLYLIEHPKYKEAEKRVKNLMKPFAKQIKKEWFEVDIEMAKNSLDTLLTEYYLPKSRITL